MIYNGFTSPFVGFSIISTVMFMLVFAVFIVFIVKGLRQWNRNNNSPRLTVYAVVVSKHTDVSHHRHGNAGDVTGAHGYHTTTSTTCYITFQVDSGDRMVFTVDNYEYGMLIEGDRGKLTFQGTRYLGFERM